MGRNLVYTLALDREGETGHRNLAKLLVSSLLRTRFTGDILVFHNSPSPLFMVARDGVEEVHLNVTEKTEDPREFAGCAQSRKHAVAEHIDGTRYDRIMFIDCDALVLRNIDHLFAEPCKLAVVREPGTKIQMKPYCGYLSPEERANLSREGLNSGTWIVDGSRLAELLARWRSIEGQTPVPRDCMREQSAFNRVVLDWDGDVKVWPDHLVALPFCNSRAATFSVFTKAAVVHAAGASLDDKLHFLFSLFAGTFLFDPQLLLFNVLEM